MPLRTCPDCDSLISTVAEKCPHCGRPMEAEAARPRSRSGLGAVQGAAIAVGNTVQTVYKALASAVIVLVLGALLFIFFSHPQTVVPWTLSAESTLKRSLNGDFGRGVAASIVGIAHPTGGAPKLRETHVEVVGDTINMTVTVNWTGGFLGGNYHTVVLWKFNERRSLGIQVVQDDALIPIANANYEQLQRYFDETCYQNLKDAVGVHLY